MGLLSSSSSDPEAEFVDQIALFTALLCACIVIGHLLEKSRWINQSITSLLIGLGTGCVILLTSGGKSSRILEFQQEFFFMYLLPPIIFNAGYQFFRNFMTIVSYGAIGTLISFAIISYGATRLFPKLDIGYLEIKDYLALGAIFSATDSVCVLQGVVNDATSVVLFNAVMNFDLSDMNTAVAYKFAGNFLSLHSTDREIALMILMAYLSYITAEVFKLSGILTVFFCGILMSHYAWHNVTLKSQVTTRHTFATMSFIAEVFIFLYVGMDSLDVEKWRFVDNTPGKSIGASATLLGLIMVGRAAFVLPLSYLSNLTRKERHEKVGFKQQVTVWWAGLMRGAVSVALAYKKVFGLLTKPFLRMLLPHPPEETEPSSPRSLAIPLLGNGGDLDAERGNLRTLPTTSSLKMLLNSPTNTVHHYWRRFDDSVMRPIFGGRGFVSYATGTRDMDVIH
ncbi:Cation/H+ exchanger [Cynara cardunculus var. scolymus]|uniref:Cation/H+ exchanger n=1 Tax=Cynara cardunculus var. scolymus TaxID=59895 RepID=A0A103XPE6_CYNCS|nr:Cation/H+ exchanger [Cynara cardunculus var. scolymus]